MTNAPTMNAIPTKYKGTTFRSRLEARWAIFLSELGIEWQYEAEGYQLANGEWYLPDFWLPGHDMFFEIKPEGDTLGAAKCEQLALLTHKRVALSNGSRYEMADVDIAVPQFISDSEADEYVSAGWMVAWDCYGFIVCRCGRATLSYYGSCSRHEGHLCGTRKGGYRERGSDYDRDTERAYATAMAYRFWDPVVRS
jgi:hypothetical protein